MANRKTCKKPFQWRLSYTEGFCGNYRYSTPIYVQLMYNNGVKSQFRVKPIPNVIHTLHSMIQVKTMYFYVQMILIKMIVENIVATV